MEARGLGVLEQGREDALALDERRHPQIEPVEVEQVESEVDHALRAAPRAICLQRVKVGDARLALHDDLAVEDGIVGRLVGQKAWRPVVPRRVKSRTRPPSRRACTR